MKDLRQRIIPAILAAAVALTLIQWSWGFALMVSVAVIGTAFEMYRLCFRIQPYYKTAFLFVNVLMTIYTVYVLLHHAFPDIFLNQALSLIPGWSFVIYGGLLILLRFRNAVREALPFINLIYPFIGWLATIELAFLSNGYDWRPLLLLLVCVWSADAAAYLVGSKIGGRKLAVGISPNKTISGWVGAFVGVAVATLLMEWWWFEWTALAIVLWIPGIWFFATLGDLFESLIKRLAVIKDSGFFLPGHGGFLDRLDSLIYSAPIAYFILHYINT